MARPQRTRRICKAPKCSFFYPLREEESMPIMLGLDEYEVIRLVDLEKMTHEECASQMDISRSTVQEIYESARTKLASALVHGKPLSITGGSYRICSNDENNECECCTQKIKRGEDIMKIAVTYDNGEIFQHFGHTENFKIYDVVDNKIASAEVISTEGSGHGALASLLMLRGVDVLICGGIGGGAQIALREAGIKLYGGVSGNADAAVNALLSGELDYNPDVRCSHHDHEHESGEHSCGNHGCGGHSCH